MRVKGGMVYLSGALFQDTDWPSCAQLVSFALAKAFATSNVNGCVDFRPAPFEAALESACLEIRGCRRRLSSERELAIEFVMQVRRFGWIVARKLADVDLRAGHSSKRGANRCQDASGVTRINDARLRAELNKYVLPELRSEIDRFHHNCAQAKLADVALSYSPTDTASTVYCDAFARGVVAWSASNGFARFVAGFTSDDHLSAAVTKRPDFKQAFIDLLVKALSATKGFDHSVVAKALNGPMKGAVPRFAQLICTPLHGESDHAGYVAAIARTFAQAILTSEWEHQLKQLQVPVLSGNRLRILTEVHAACGVFSRWLQAVVQGGEAVPSAAKEWARQSVGAVASVQHRGLTVSDLALRVKQNYLEVPPAVLIRWSALTSTYLPQLAALRDEAGRRDWATTLMFAARWPLAKVDGDDGGSTAENPESTVRRRARKTAPKIVPSTAAAYKAWGDDGGALGLLHHPTSRIVKDFAKTSNNWKKAGRFDEVERALEAKVLEHFEHLRTVEASDPRQSGEFLRAESIGGLELHARRAQLLADEIIWRDDPVNAEKTEADEATEADVEKADVEKAEVDNAEGDRTLPPPERGGPDDSEETADDDSDETADDDWSLSWDSDDLSEEASSEFEEISASTSPGEPVHSGHDLRGAITFPSYIEEVAKSFDRMKKLDELLAGVPIAVRLNAIARVMQGADALAALPPSWIGRLLIWPVNSTLAACAQGKLTAPISASQFSGLPSAEYLYASVQGEDFASYAEFELATSAAEALLRGVVARPVSQSASRRGDV